MFELCGCLLAEIDQRDGPFVAALVRRITAGDMNRCGGSVWGSCIESQVWHEAVVSKRPQ